MVFSALVALIILNTGGRIHADEVQFLQVARERGVEVIEHQPGGGEVVEICAAAHNIVFGTDMAPAHGNVQQQALKWATFHAGDLIRGRDQTSKNRIGELVAKAINEKLSVPGLQKALLGEFQDMAE
jgi:hypothetical protein